MGNFEELLLILAVALLLFGPSKLTDLAKAMGGALHEFKKAANPEENANKVAPANPAPAQAQAALPTESKASEPKDPSTPA
jgi:sec-independent protein translocase protein TatA